MRASLPYATLTRATYPTEITQRSDYNIMTKLKVGIIGLGGIARSHCDAIAGLDNVEIVAVADLFEEKRNEYMKKYDIPRGYASHTELLADNEVDAVAVVLGHQLHHRLTIDACRAGKHVLVEKPSGRRGGRLRR